MKFKNPVFYLLLLGALIMLSCSSNNNKFTLKGDFTSTDGETVYLEHRSLGGIVLLDSTKIASNGSFKLKGDLFQNPEFYQLRVNNKIAVFTVDDDNKEIVVHADLNNLTKTFKVDNSIYNDQIHSIDEMTSNAKKQIDALEKLHSSKQLDDVEYLNSIDTILIDYKSDLTKIILGDPSGPAAYYAVFQKINNYLIFDPYDKQDYAMYGAVATSWDKRYSETERSKHLYDFTMNALKTRKQQEKQSEFIENATVITDSSLPDISLKEVSGKNISLQSLKGKVVVLDFTVYNSEFSPKHNIDLNNLYSSIKSQGVEIYQISFDSDEHFWKNAASNLPWVTVRDPQSVYSKLLSTYNVRELPTAFVINREGDVVARIENFNTLESEIKKVLN